MKEPCIPVAKKQLPPITANPGNNPLFQTIKIDLNLLDLRSIKPDAVIVT